MARLHESIQVRRPPGEVFAFVADFGNVAQWDPGVTNSQRTSDGEVGLGSTFHVEAEFLGRKVAMDYEITEFVPPERVVLAGRGARFQAVDDIRFSAVGDGTRIDYEAQFTMPGLFHYLDGALRPLFRRLARRAMAGLRARLDDAALPL